MSEHQPLLHDVRTTHVNDFLTVPGSEVVVLSRHGESWSVDRLASLLNRLAGQDGDRRVEFWIKLEN